MEVGQVRMVVLVLGKIWSYDIILKNWKLDGNLKKELWRKSKSRWLCLRGGCLGETVWWRTHRVAGEVGR